MKKKIIKDNIRLRYLMPIIIILAVIPLIVHMKEIKLSKDYIEVWSVSKTNVDFFSYYKMIAFLITTIAAIGVGIIGIRRKEILVIKSHYNTLIAISSVIIFLSTILSKYKIVSLVGFYDRYEGMFVLLGYMFILFYAIHVIASIKETELILKILIISSSLVLLVGVLQLFDYNPFKYDLVQSVIISSTNSGSIDFTNQRSIVYSTLYNSNYVGSYIAMILPISCLMLLSSDYKKNRAAYILLSIVTLLAFIIWTGSGSRAGLLGGGVSLGILFILLRKKILKNRQFIKVIFAIIVFASIATVFAPESRLYRGVVSEANKPSINRDRSTRSPIKEFKIDKNQVMIGSTTEVLYFKIEGNDLSFYDEDFSKLNFVVNDNEIKLLDERYFDYTFKLDARNPLITINAYDITARAHISPQSEIKLLNHMGIPSDTIEPLTYGFEGRERMGSSRGYIWSRSLPLLKDTLFIGNGPDTYALYFPQNDLIGKFLILGTPELIIDKPHNLFLQMAINTGVISLIVFLIIILMYMKDSLSLYRKSDKYKEENVLNTGILSAIIGYLVAGLFNDSYIGVAPIFWILLGLGINFASKSHKTT